MPMFQENWAEILPKDHPFLKVWVETLTVSVESKCIQAFYRIYLLFGCLETGLVGGVIVVFWPLDTW